MPLRRGSARSWPDSGGRSNYADFGAAEILSGRRRLPVVPRMPLAGTRVTHRRALALGGSAVVRKNVGGRNFFILGAGDQPFDVMCKPGVGGGCPAVVCPGDPPQPVG